MGGNSARSRLRIAKPISEVFDAVVNPVKLCHYFTDYASGRLEPNRIVQWRFDGYESTPKVQVVEVIPEEKIIVTHPYKVDFESFQSIAKDQSFYINNDGKLVISFDKYEVSPGYMGVVEFIIPTPVITDALVSNAYIK